MELKAYIPAAHRLLEDARRADRGALDEALGASSIVGVVGEAEVGKSALITRVLRDQAIRPLRVDLRDAASPAHLSWLIARALASQVLPPTQRSLLTGSQDLAPSKAREAMLDLQRSIGHDLAQLALADAPEHDIPLDQAIGAIGSLADPATLWIDHIESPSLTSRHPVDSEAFLWGLRELAQRTDVRLVLTVNTAALKDVQGPAAAFHQDGTWVTVTRPAASTWTTVRDELGLSLSGQRLDDLYDRLSGHPPTMILALGELINEPDLPIDTLIGRLALRDDGCTRCATQLARSLHRLGADVLQRIAQGRGPYVGAGVSRNQDLHTALTRLHRAGLVWQPAQQRWEPTNPLLALRLREARRHSDTAGGLDVVSLAGVDDVRQGLVGDELAGVLGEAAAARLAAQARTLGAELGGADSGQLAGRVAAGRRALARLDREGARQTLDVQARRADADADAYIAEQQQQARRPLEQADRQPGWRGRSERGRLRRAAGEHQRDEGAPGDAAG